MKELIESLNQSIKQKNWHAALFLSLSMPDICGKLETQNPSVGKRYKEWFTKYLQSQYTKKKGADNEEIIFLNASDCYALRCALLHEGSDKLSNQEAREVLDRFVFSTTLPHLSLHNGLTLILNVEEFCSEMYSAVNNWINQTKSDFKIFEIHNSNKLIL